MGDIMPKLRPNYETSVLAVLVILISSAVLLPSLTYATPTTVQVTPSITKVTIGTVFNINVTVTDVTNLYAWEFRLYFLNAIINCTSVTEGSFLLSAGTTMFILNVTNNYNSTYGRILAACTLLGGGKSVNGSGTLATITFKATADGSTNLDLEETKLSTINSESIPHTTIGGRVRVGQGGTVHDITVVDVTALKSAVGKGYPDNITVTIQNSGDYTETFNVTVRANATDVGIKELTLASGDFVPVIIVWNTTGFSYGKYAISAYAWPVVNETNTVDNTKADGIVTVTIIGDIRGDGNVDIYDAILLANAYNTKPGYPNWNPNADINCDNIVDIYDAILLANHYGQVIQLG
jgi:hypothetical protein